MPLSLIVAMNRNNVIGIDNKIPWKNTDDMKNFVKLTSDKTVIMGHNTYKSIGHRLYRRLNLIISASGKSSFLHPFGSVIYLPIDQVLHYDKSDNEVFVIGGRSIYKQLAKYINKMYITIVDDFQNEDNAVYFPWESFVETSWQIQHQEQWNNAWYYIMEKQ